MDIMWWGTGTYESDLKACRVNCLLAVSSRDVSLCIVLAASISCLSTKRAVMCFCQEKSIEYRGSFLADYISLGGMHMFMGHTKLAYSLYSVPLTAIILYSSPSCGWV